MYVSLETIYKTLPYNASPIFFHTASKILREMWYLHNTHDMLVNCGIRFFQPEMRYNIQIFFISVSP